MFTRSLFSTADMHRQGEILNDVTKMLDDGRSLHQSLLVL
jgi:NADPH2:quinone reductase